MTRRQSSHQSRQTLAAVMLATLMTGAGGLSGPVVAAAHVRLSVTPWLNLAGDLLGQQFLARAAEVLAGPAQVSAGSDGRITVLMVGSDRRPDSTNGERLDTIMVMSLNTTNSEISAISIPRDTARIPMPPALGGGIFTNKINGMFKYFKKQTKNPQLALEKFRQVVAYVLGIQIDYVAYIRFNGFDTLVDAADGIHTSIPAEIHDPSYIDKPGWPTGARFVVDSSALLKGASAPRCYGGYPKPVKNWSIVPNCTRALVYVRSRHGKVGTQGNNDYVRAKRQQTFVFDAIKWVRKSSARAQTVRAAANQIPVDFYTTIPIGTVSDGLALYQLVQDATMPRQAVLKPPTYASKIPGTSANRLNLGAVRALCHQWMGPV